VLRTGALFVYVDLQREYGTTVFIYPPRILFDCFSFSFSFVGEGFVCMDMSMFAKGDIVKLKSYPSLDRHGRGVEGDAGGGSSTPR